MKKTIASLALLLALTSCSQNQVLASLEGSIAAATILVNTLPNIPPDVRSGVTTALLPLPGIITQTTAELSSADTDVVRAIRIQGYWQPELRALSVLPPNVQIYTSSVAAAIQAFLAYYPLTQTLARTGTPGKSTKFSARELRKINVQAEELAAKLGVKP